MKPIIYLCSPFRHDTEEGRKTYREYLEVCMCHSIACEECPIASHRLYSGILDDRTPKERELGMSLGLRLMHCASLIAVYRDYGISVGMKAEIEYAKTIGLRIEMRQIGQN